MLLIQAKQLNEMEKLKFINEHWSIIAALFAAISIAVGFLWKKRNRIGHRIKIIAYNFVDFVTDKDASTVSKIQTSVDNLSEYVKTELGETKTLLLDSSNLLSIHGKQIQDILAEQRFLTEIDERGFFKMDLEGNCVVANAKANQICGAEIDRMSAGEWWGLIHPDDQPHLEKNWNFAYSKKCDMYSVHRLVLRDRQEIRTVEVSTKPCKIEGQFAGFNGIVKLIKTEPLEDIHTSLSANRKLTDEETGNDFWIRRRLGSGNQNDTAG